MKSGGALYFYTTPKGFCIEKPIRACLMIFRYTLGLHTYLGSTVMPKAMCYFLAIIAVLI